MKRSWFAAGLAAALTAGALGVAPPLQASVQDVQLRASSRSIAQGRPLVFSASAFNDAEFSQTVTVVFALKQVKGPEPTVEFRRWSQTVGPGSTGRYRGHVNPGQWFRRRGGYRLLARVDGKVVARWAFEITAPPVRPARFRDVTEEVGIRAEMPDFSCGGWAAGAAWSDVDGDGRLDLFMPTPVGADHLWMNQDGGFVDQASERGVGGGDVVGLGAVFADVDNDGDPDLYVNSDGPNLLYLNDGAGNFEEVGATAGVAGDEPSQSASFADFDRDGLLDLFVANHARCDGGARSYYHDRLYRNLGDGTFEDRTDLLHEDASTEGAGFQGGWFDADGDLDMDLYLGNDYWGPRPQPNVFWRNDMPVGFTDRSVESNVSISMNSMGMGIADYDRDGDFDVVVSNIRAPALLNNDGSGVFRDLARRADLDRDHQDATSLSISWGITFADLNNDSWEDVYIPAGRLGKATTQPNAVFLGRGGRFLDLSAISRADDLGVSRGVAVDDYDGDGRLDLFVVNQDGRPRLFRNVTSPRAAHWLRVDLTGQTSTRDACGAIVRVKVRGALMTKQMTCGGTSLASAGDSVIHFGLGRREKARRVQVLWPSGKRSVRTGVRADRSLSIEEPTS